MQLPTPVRAVIGLAASVADEARHLPERAVELPMAAVSSVLQASLRAQQRYAALTARGDAVLSRAPGDEPPAWATFDDDVPAEPTEPAHRGYTDGRRAAQILDDILGEAGIASGDEDDQTEHDGRHDGEHDGDELAARRPANKTARRSANKATGKRVSKPRNGSPSKFDDAGD